MRRSRRSIRFFPNLRYFTLPRPSNAPGSIFSISLLSRSRVSTKEFTFKSSMSVSDTASENTEQLLSTPLASHSHGRHVENTSLSRTDATVAATMNPEVITK